ncbi:hypothetical protein [Kitasatospora sp. NPDC004289]
MSITIDMALVAADAQLSNGSAGLAEVAALVVLGLLAMGLGILWAINYRAMVTCRHSREEADRAQLPILLRQISPPPVRPAIQRLTGVLLAVTGCVFVLSGAYTLVRL